jgi:hypothetical protein
MTGHPALLGLGHATTELLLFDVKRNEKSSDMINYYFEQRLPPDYSDSTFRPVSFQAKT